MMKLTLPLAFLLAFFAFSAPAQVRTIQSTQDAQRVTQPIGLTWYQGESVTFTLTSVAPARQAYPIPTNDIVRWDLTTTTNWNLSYFQITGTLHSATGGVSRYVLPPTNIPPGRYRGYVHALQMSGTNLVDHLVLQYQTVDILASSAALGSLVVPTLPYVSAVVGGAVTTNGNVITITPGAGSTGTLYEVATTITGLGVLNGKGPVATFTGTVSSAAAYTNRYTGAGTTGSVTGASSATNLFFRADGTFAVPPDVAGTLTGAVVAAGSSARLTATNDGTVNVKLNFDATGIATGGQWNAAVAGASNDAAFAAAVGNNAFTIATNAITGLSATSALLTVVKDGSNAVIGLSGSIATGTPVYVVTQTGRVGSVNGVAYDATGNVNVTAAQIGAATGTPLYVVSQTGAVLAVRVDTNTTTAGTVIILTGANLTNTAAGGTNTLSVQGLVTNGQLDASIAAAGLWVGSNYLTAFEGTNLVNRATNVSARLASNVWAAADSTTNYVRRTGDNLSGGLTNQSSDGFIGNGVGLSNVAAASAIQSTIAGSLASVINLDSSANTFDADSDGFGKPRVHYYDNYSAANYYIYFRGFSDNALASDGDLLVFDGSTTYSPKSLAIIATNYLTLTGNGSGLTNLTITGYLATNAVLAGNGLAVTLAGGQATFALSNNLTLIGGITVTNGSFVGNGSSVTNLTAANIPAGQTLNALNGANVTNLTELDRIAGVTASNALVVANVATSALPSKLFTNAVLVGGGNLGIVITNGGGNVYVATTNSVAADGGFLTVATNGTGNVVTNLTFGGTVVTQQLGTAGGGSETSKVAAVLLRGNDGQGLTITNFNGAGITNLAARSWTTTAVTITPDIRRTNGSGRTMIVTCSVTGTAAALGSVIVHGVTETNGSFGHFFVAGLAAATASAGSELTMIVQPGEAYWVTNLSVGASTVILANGKETVDGGVAVASSGYITNIVTSAGLTGSVSGFQAFLTNTMPLPAQLAPYSLEVIGISDSHGTNLTAFYTSGADVLLSLSTVSATNAINFQGVVNPSTATLSTPTFTPYLLKIPELATNFSRLRWKAMDNQATTAQPALALSWNSGANFAIMTSVVSAASTSTSNGYAIAGWTNGFQGRTIQIIVSYTGASTNNLNTRFQGFEQSQAQPLFTVEP